MTPNSLRRKLFSWLISCGWSRDGATAQVWTFENWTPVDALFFFSGLFRSSFSGSMSNKMITPPYFHSKGKFDPCSSARHDVFFFHQQNIPVRGREKASALSLSLKKRNLHQFLISTRRPLQVRECLEVLSAKRRAGITFQSNEYKFKLEVSPVELVW